MGDQLDSLRLLIAELFQSNHGLKMATLKETLQSRQLEHSDVELRQIVKVAILISGLIHNAIVRENTWSLDRKG